MNQPAASRLAENALAALREIIPAVGEGLPADRRVSQLFNANRNWGSRDRKFIAALVFSFFRWRGWLRDLDLRIAASLAFSLDSSKPHPAHTALAGYEMPAWGGLSVAEKKFALEAMTGRALTIEALVPAWFHETVATRPGNKPDALIESFQMRPPTWVRACEGHTGEVLQALTEHEAVPRLDARIANAIACLATVNFVEVRRDAGAVFEVQDIASQVVGHICDPKPGQRWWDACAASGGKALHLADLMRDTGEIVATDVRESALEQLSLRSDKSGFHIIHPLRAGADPDGDFDGVLADAPCSGIGTWSRNPDMRWRTNAEDVDRCAEKQSEILFRTADRVKTGGTLVFAVCTMTNAETRAIVDAFLSVRSDFEPFPFVNPLDLGTGRHPSSSVQLLPADGPGDGMFIARFRRK